MAAPLPYLILFGQLAQLNSNALKEHHSNDNKAKMRNRRDEDYIEGGGGVKGPLYLEKAMVDVIRVQIAHKLSDDLALETNHR